ncbi:dimethylaniline monooxygenase [N-oxide-forming] 2-like [Anabas testudineus]|uniref:Flavin-containing monooxygenase n=1 Tax=Anabas testudineus TaxID=64144 RepID=A0A3Q1J1W5_ANATE|nr:dimethylaniline monooxygenase [N-oxide-forming] 2-like [Anabas testudineus]XP_026201347.1 dimethylaniline monooxygenase [N-oxide-forming] 2-like [Anabas testudineus]XP_026201348.1 dimethylaniline monooxygenase [N-oxide-forming] 2-like [Anabas testudineus]
MVRRVAVVGAGTSGLACVKTCVDEGLEPVCFESSTDIGGLWQFKESPEPERSSIYRSLVTNTSKEIMCFSDFPMPADYPNYMHHSKVLQYLRLYAHHFDLLRYINFQTTVKSVTQRPDFSVTGQWDVVTTNRDGKEERHIFDAVLVCSGHFTHPDLPLSDFPGYETFTGRCFHSWEYKDADACKGKRVVVVGIGSSAADIAVEISRSAQKTFLSTRQGAWVFGKMSSRGLPLDITAITRFNNILMQLLPKTLLNWAIERSLNQKYDHRLYGLKPSHRALERRLVINDNLPGQILQGAIVMKPNLKGFKDSGVLFEDDTLEEDIDVVVFGTGYKEHFPFLTTILSHGPHGELMLYKGLFPSSLQFHTLAIIGNVYAKGPAMPLVEMQARWTVKVFSGSCRLPSQKKMLAVIESKKKMNMKSLFSPRVAALQVDYIPYLDFLAQEIGVRPNFLKLLLRDPVLWKEVVFGPCTPYQYRLTGPGQWAGARHAILTQWERVAQPFRTRAAPEPVTRSSVFFSSWLLTFGGSVVIAMLLCKNQVFSSLQGAAHMVDRINIS